MVASSVLAIMLFILASRGKAHSVTREDKFPTSKHTRVSAKTAQGGRQGKQMQGQTDRSDISNVSLKYISSPSHKNKCKRSGQCFTEEKNQPLFFHKGYLRNLSAGAAGAELAAVLGESTPPGLRAGCVHQAEAHAHNPAQQLGKAAPTAADQQALCVVDTSEQFLVHNTPSSERFIPFQLPSINKDVFLLCHGCFCFFLQPEICFKFLAWEGFFLASLIPAALFCLRIYQLFLC